MKKQFVTPEIPRLPPKPSAVAGVARPVVSLDGEWRIRRGDDMDALIHDTAYQAWDAVAVPSFMSAERRAMPNTPRRYVCKREIEIRDEWRGKRLYLRFETVNGIARVYVDGAPVGEHINGFLAFGMDITEHARGKATITLAVAVEELADKVSTFNVGGILRSVALYVLPETHIAALYVTTPFDSQFRSATVNIRYALSGMPEGARVVASLTDPTGLPVTETGLPPVDAATRFGEGTLPVERPLPWDAEHPWLYTLTLRVMVGDAVAEETSLRVGLRQIDRSGNKLFVNGREVKLRGACRHEISAKNGRCLTRELIERDVALFKEANCNYIRTSHYPPSEYFLDLCDEAGMYVEDELPLAFIARTLDFTQRDPAQTTRYLSVFGDIYARDANHPSVLMWSLCNESFGGYNFDLLNQFARRTDTTRPTKFSYPMTMREEHAPVDIWSVHYANWDFDLGSKMDNVSVAGAPGRDMPVLHDEFAHVPCYNRTEHRRDPNVRAFWGEGLAKFWDSIWNTDGALGGAIWAGIDETDIYRGGESRLEWGIIDIWRRRKPEHYMTRRAYSPIVAALLPGDGAGGVTVRVENRFCHTDLSEVKIAWRYGGREGNVRGPEAPPRGTGELTLPVKAIPGVALELTFIDARGCAVDEYRFVPLPMPEQENAAAHTPLALAEDNDSATITGDGFGLRFSKHTGLIERGSVDGETVLIGGPALHAPYFRLGAWTLDAFRCAAENGAVRVDIRGAYAGSAEVSFVLRVLPDGTIETDYTIDKLLRPLPRGEKLRVGVDCGGLDELGVAFAAAPGADRLSWKRDGLYTVYPDDHIARNEGTARRFGPDSAFGQEPGVPWGEDMRNVILNGRYDVDYRGSNDFRSLKANVRAASLLLPSGAAVTAVSDGAHSARAEVMEPEDRLIPAADARVRYGGAWFDVEDARGSRFGVERWSREAGAYAELNFTGTGVVWYGPVDTVYGIARVYLDGELVDERISQRVAGVDFPGSAAGYDKKYGYPLYSAQGLADGPHTLRVEATGDKFPDAGDAYIVIDHFRVIGKRGEEPVGLLVLNDYNYPHIAWGNPARPAILVTDGATNRVAIRLGKANEYGTAQEGAF